MVNETKDQSESELFEPEATEPESSGESTSDDQSDSESSTEEIEQPLDLEENKVKKQADEKQKQISSWVNRVNAGKANISDIPFDWLKKEVEARVSPPVDFDKIIEEKLRAKEAEKRFTELKAGLNSLKLTGAQKEEVKATYSELVADGVAKDKALEVAMKAAGVKSRRESELFEQRDALRLPITKAGQYRPEPKGEELLKQPVAKRLEAYEAIRKNKAL